MDVTCKISERVEQQICIKFGVKLEHSFVETIWMIQKAAAMGKWRLAASSWQCAHSGITSHAEFFGETSNHPGDSVSLQPRFGALQLLAFPKTKITSEREELETVGEIHKGADDGNWRTGWSPKVPILKGTEASLSYARCFLYLVSSSINVFIFHSTCLDTFWTDLIFNKYLVQFLPCVKNCTKHWKYCVKKWICSSGNQEWLQVFCPEQLEWFVFNFNWRSNMWN